MLGVFADWSLLVLRLQVSDRAQRLMGVMATFPNEVRYDPVRHEGLVCSAAGSPPLALASLFTPEPFTFRPLGAEPVAIFAAFNGCDWDADHRTILVTNPVLGLLATVDRDSGRVRRTRFVGFGARAVALDEPRGRVYVGNFFRGDVQALDLSTGREMARWFLGRYLRDLRLTRDGRFLLVTSTLGIVRVRL